MARGGRREILAGEGRDFYAAFICFSLSTSSIHQIPTWRGHGGVINSTRHPPISTAGSYFLWPTPGLSGNGHPICKVNNCLEAQWFWDSRLQSGFSRFSTLQRREEARYGWLERRNSYVRGAHIKTKACTMERDMARMVVAYGICAMVCQ